jgi:hypothetical protein
MKENQILTAASSKQVNEVSATIDNTEVANGKVTCI